MPKQPLNLTGITERVQLVGRSKQYKYAVGLSWKRMMGLWNVVIDYLRETSPENPLTSLDRWCKEVAGGASSSFSANLEDAIEMGVVIFGTNMLEAAREATKGTRQFLEKAMEAGKNEEGHQLPGEIILEKHAHTATAELFHRNCGEILRAWKLVCDRVSQTFGLSTQPFPNVSHTQIDWQTIYQALEKGNAQQSNQLIGECLHIVEEEMRRIDSALTPRRGQTKRKHKKQ